MREYRAWDKKEKYWLNPEHFYITGEGRAFTCQQSPSAISRRYELMGTDRYVIEQNTGLKDKNGVGIYEGDIIEYFQFSHLCSKCAHRDKSVNEVVFNSLGATLSSYRIIDPMADISELEVIGNIHDNLEAHK